MSTIEKLVHREAKFKETTGTVALFLKKSPQKQFYFVSIFRFRPTNNFDELGWLDKFIFGSRDILSFEYGLLIVIARMEGPTIPVPDDL